MSLLDRLQDGKEHVVSQAEYGSFLDILPPVCLTTNYQDRRWDFGFAEGADHVFLFRKAGDRCFAIKTPFLNPFEAGSFETQKRRWILRWIALARKDPAFHGISLPRIDTQTIREATTDRELLNEIRANEHSPGEGVFVGNLCFIKVADQADAWLVLKGPFVVGRASFRQLLEAGGPDAESAYLDSLRAASIEAISQDQFHRRR